MLQPSGEVALEAAGDSSQHSTVLDQFGLPLLPPPHDSMCRFTDLTAASEGDCAYSAAAALSDEFPLRNGRPI